MSSFLTFLNQAAKFLNFIQTSRGFEGFFTAGDFFLLKKKKTVKTTLKHCSPHRLPAAPSTNETN